MKRDIFIDNNIASKFSNPQDVEYIKLTRWLMQHSKIDMGQIDTNAYLVVSQKLLVEYYNSARGAKSATSIPAIIDKLTREGRLVTISKQQITNFKNEHFVKRVEQSLTCNHQDRDLIPVVLLSERKYALSYDENFSSDLSGIPGFTVTVSKRPENIAYDQ